MKIQKKFHGLIKRHNFYMTSLSSIKVNPVIFLFQRILKGNQSMFRFFGISAATLLGVGLIDTIFSSPSNIYDIDDYYDYEELEENVDFQIYGLLKPNSFYLNSDTNNFHFTITNLKKEIDIVYKGEIPYEFKEGDNLILTCYLPNKKVKNRLVANQLATNHSLEVENWEGKASQIKNNSILI